MADLNLFILCFFLIGTKGQEDGLSLLQQYCDHKHDFLDSVVLVIAKSKSLDVLEEICFVYVLFKQFPC